ncbi:flagellar basal body protein [Alphaproteobacteria bacterium LSUCC0719]
MGFVPSVWHVFCKTKPSEKNFCGLTMFYTAMTGLKVSQKDLANTSHNIANTGTVGFKKSSLSFSDIHAASV